jgi:heptaprenylglyceryl phosphate synthase
MPENFLNAVTPTHISAWTTVLDSARQIKLKKDYIAGLGDTVDFVIVGGSRDARDKLNSVWENCRGPPSSTVVL